VANRTYKRTGNYFRRNKTRPTANYIETRTGRLKWCEVLSAEGAKNCTLEFCTNEHRRLEDQESRVRVKRRPHSFPRPWWDKTKGRPIPVAERVPI